MKILAFFGVALAIAFALFFVFGRENSLRMLFGDADLGRTEFQKLKKGGKPNWALACPQDFWAVP